ncbi:unnamed protein product [Protopolystoma xenopodis]|uniref:Uncharacterized protein n=1 Tax=Protopolystoma xenopodis TaxID=117903 RepID=A0A3S5CW01_9PLAT|nr:unnamed protein product [Protopolystoma xenopodis]
MEAFTIFRGAHFGNHCFVHLLVSRSRNRPLVRLHFRDSLSGWLTVTFVLWRRALANLVPASRPVCADRESVGSLQRFARKLSRSRKAPAYKLIYATRQSRWKISSWAIRS